jgi:hypothetical protein
MRKEGKESSIDGKKDKEETEKGRNERIKEGRKEERTEERSLEQQESVGDADHIT